MRRTIFQRMIEQTTRTIVEPQPRRSRGERAVGAVTLLALAAMIVLVFIVPGIRAIDGDYVRFSAKFGSRRFGSDEARWYGPFCLSIAAAFIFYAIGQFTRWRVAGNVVAGMCLTLACVAAYFSSSARL